MSDWIWVYVYLTGDNVKPVPYNFATKQMSSMVSLKLFHALYCNAFHLSFQSKPLTSAGCFCLTVAYYGPLWSTRDVEGIHILIVTTVVPSFHILSVFSIQLPLFTVWSLFELVMTADMGQCQRGRGWCEGEWGHCVCQPVGCCPHILQRSALNPLRSVCVCGGGGGGGVGRVSRFWFLLKCPSLSGA